MIKLVNNFLKKLTKVQKMLLGVVIGYFIYVTYIRVEHFFNEEEDTEIEDKPIKAGIFDVWAQNIGLETENTLLAKRQEKAKADNYMKYEGDDEVRKALAIADDYKKY